jgi:hypothetical protein
VAIWAGMKRQRQSLRLPLPPWEAWESCLWRCIVVPLEPPAFAAASSGAVACRCVDPFLGLARRIAYWTKDAHNADGDEMGRCLHIVV